MNKIIFRLKNVTIRVGDRHILQNTSWTIRDNEHWAVVGPNGSGKTSLAKALIDEYYIVRGTTCKDDMMKRPNSTGYVSFEQQQDLHDHSERKQHAFSFSGKIQEMITPETVIGAGSNRDEITELLGIHHLLTLPMISLSNGEVRKVLIARALVKKPVLLVLDEPFEGLDINSRNILETAINQITAAGTCQVILVTHRFEHLSSSITHLLCLKDCSVVISGIKREVLASQIFKELFRKSAHPGSFSIPLITERTDKRTAGLQPVLSMQKVSVSFGETQVLNNFTWDVFHGENWILTGPNGAGKSTIVRLIFGDLTQVYSNDVTILGYQRGTGESLWDIRKSIGFLSPEFHMNYRKSVTILEVILSGFYDSIGLYRAPEDHYLGTARTWLSALGFTDRGDHQLKSFSFGEQRLILLARALVKNPPLLILDEPLQGLDPENRKTVQEMIELYGTSNTGTIIYITHHLEEMSSCFTHLMEINRSEKGFRFLASHLKTN